MGGILAGQSLIRASELRAITTEQQRYLTAVHAFRDKYLALPGDMSNATSIWGKDNANCAGHTGTAATPGTCNGDGNGNIYTTASTVEAFRFWQQLALAGLIEGTYDGIQHGANEYASTAANVPKSKLANSYWFEWYWGTVSATPSLFNGTYNNMILLGGLLADNPPYTPTLRPEEAWNIDTKMDDSRPGLGKVVAFPVTNCTDGTNTAPTTANYALTTTTLVCQPVFRNLF